MSERSIDVVRGRDDADADVSADSGEPRRASRSRHAGEPQVTHEPQGPNEPTHAGGILHVRLAQPSDEAFVAGLAVRFGTTRAPWRGYAEVVDGTRRQLMAAFDNRRDDDAILIACSESGARFGFVYIVTHDDFFTGERHAHISEIATTVDGNGAGSVLMEAAEAWARERGSRYLSLNVNDANETARRFYERREYVPEYRHLVKLLPNPGARSGD